jgi:dihydrofolate reductase
MISIIAAIDEKRGIGKNNQLPWHLPEDLKRFKEITTGETVIMGRKTFESIGKPLPNRTNIVITNNPAFQAQGSVIANSLDNALEKAKGDVFIIGGGEVFNQAILRADKLYLTLVKGDFNCDTFFPDYTFFTKETFIGAGEENGIKYNFLELEK